jgi:hypothetical protein
VPLPTGAPPPTGPFVVPPVLGALPPFGCGGDWAVNVDEKLNPIAIAAIKNIFFISRFFFLLCNLIT